MEYTSFMQKLTFERELALRSEGKSLIIGIDEAGRGPLAGPVVAAAVCYKDVAFGVPAGLEKDFALIRDSKKLSPVQREKAFALVGEHFHIGVGIVNAETIDRVNILQATFLAMKAALSDVERWLPRGESAHLLVDGNQLLPSFSGSQEAVVNGDNLVRSIAAASIIAKVTRDRMFEEYEESYPGYGFGQHKGYGTKVHMDALRQLGPCAIHRQSFKPVQLTDPDAVNRRFAAVLQKKKR